MVTKDLGMVTAYAYAVSKGYTGTEEEFAELMASYASVAQEAVDAALAAAQSAQDAQDAQTAAEGASDTAQATVSGAIAGIQAEGQTQISAVQSEGTAQVGNVNSAGQTQVGNVNAAGTTQVENVNTAGSTQVSAVQAKGTEVLNSIPSDYTELSDDVTGLKSAINVLENTVPGKVNKPQTNPNGTNGQLLRTLGNGQTEWVTTGTPTAEQVGAAVDAWLDEHPEATTTVQDGSLTEIKLSEQLTLKTVKDYVTPQMFGAKGDGTTDDYAAIVDCIEYAAENIKNIKFPRAMYTVGHSIAIEDSINIDFCNSTITYTGQNVIDDFIVYGFATNVSFSDNPGITNVKIDGNSKAKNCLHITAGKGILLRNINIVHPIEYGLLIDETDGDTWELLADNITVSGGYGNGLQCITPIKVLGISDSCFLNLYPINGSNSWMDFTGNGCTVINLHGYSYPDTFAVNNGVYVGGSANRFVNTIIDTFSDTGILVTAPQNSFINTTFAKPYSNSCIGFRVESNYIVIDSIFCGSSINLISSNANDSLTVKNINTYNVMTKDVVFDDDNLPFWFIYDNSGRATTPITKLIEQNKIVDTSGFVVTGATIGSSSVIKKSNGFLRLSFNISCSGTSVEIKTGIILPATQYLFAFNNAQTKTVLFSMWADGSIHNLGAVASGDTLVFDSVVAL